MSDRFEIRDSREGDIAGLEALYPAAFPDEDLLPLVRTLLPDTAIVVSLVATFDREVAGHVIFTYSGVADSEAKAALLGPLGVLPSRQKQGIGSALVRAGLQRMQDAGVGLVCVLGDPGYYERFGFATDADVAPPYRLPAEWAEAWQSQRLGGDRTPCAGKLLVPDQWLEPALWLP